MVKAHEFESGHPDRKTPANSGVHNNRSGALGALHFLFELGVENPNDKEKMIKSVVIKDYNGNISKRWYVEYRELDPETNKWQRRREYGGVNHSKDPAKRTKLIQDLAAEIMTSLATRITNTKKGESEIANYIRLYVADKNNSLRKSSIKNIKLSLKYFFGYLVRNNLYLLPIHQIRKNHMHEFRIWLTTKTGNRSVNGHMSFVKSFFNYFIDNYDNILYKNPCGGFRKLPSISETHVAYSQDQVTKLFDHLKNNDPGLLLYCQMVGLAFVRCDEARHLKVGDIDFSRHTITLTAGYSKNRIRVNKPLLDTFYNILVAAGIYKFPPGYYIFSYKGPGEKQVHYNYFRKRFKKLKKDFGLSPKHTIYSFRHTYVSQLLDNGAKWHEVMKYTGHTTMEGFSNYARSLHVKPAEDLSRYLNQ